MNFQDILFSAGIVVFTLSLLPALRNKEYPPVSTSVSYALVLVVFTGLYWSLDLWVSMVLGAVNSLVWWYIAWDGKRRL